MALLSVIIPCYNAARWVGETLESVLIQRGVTLQVIVVDDGSTDESAALIAGQFPQVELIRTTNGGQCHARNVGLKHALGELLQFIDADDLLLPDKLAQQSSRLAQGDADIVYSDWRRIFDGDDGSIREGPVIVRELGDDPASDLVNDAWSPPHAYLFRRELVERVGAFPERYWFTGDARYLIECALRGARFVRVPGLFASYRVHDGQLSQQKRDAWLRECLWSTQEAQAWWESNGGVNPQRHNALVHAYSLVARASYAEDPAVFGEAYRALLVLEPNYLPSAPPFLRLAARVVGYPRAEALARRYRQFKGARAG